MQTDYTILQLDWTEASGHFKKVGSPYHFGWLRAVYIPRLSISDGKVVIVSRDHRSAEWSETHGSVSQPDAMTLVRMLAGLGLPDRAPSVENVPDSSDMWSTCNVRVSMNEAIQVFQIHTECSGFRGPDASGLRELFRAIYAMAGYAGMRTMFD